LIKECPEPPEAAPVPHLPPVHLPYRAFFGAVDSRSAGRQRESARGNAHNAGETRGPNQWRTGMTLRNRKLVGAVALIVLVFGWVFLGLALAPAILPSSGAVVTIVFYAVAGLGWLVIAMPLVSWMSRPDPAA
jgi:hypothetical protein